MQLTESQKPTLNSSSMREDVVSNAGSFRGGPRSRIYIRAEETNRSYKSEKNILRKIDDVFVALINHVDSYSIKFERDLAIVNSNMKQIKSSVQSLSIRNQELQMSNRNLLESLISAISQKVTEVCNNCVESTKNYQRLANVSNKELVSDITNAIKSLNDQICSQKALSESEFQIRNFLQQVDSKIKNLNSEVPYNVYQAKDSFSNSDLKAFLSQSMANQKETQESIYRKIKKEMLEYSSQPRESIFHADIRQMVSESIEPLRRVFDDLPSLNASGQFFKISENDPLYSTSRDLYTPNFSGDDALNKLRATGNFNSQFSMGLVNAKLTEIENMNQQIEASMKESQNAASFKLYESHNENLSGSFKKPLRLFSLESKLDDVVGKKSSNSTSENLVQNVPASEKPLLEDKLIDEKSLQLVSNISTTTGMKASYTNYTETEVPNQSNIIDSAQQLSNETFPPLKSDFQKLEGKKPFVPLNIDASVYSKLSKLNALEANDFGIEEFTADLFDIRAKSTPRIYPLAENMYSKTIVDDPSDTLEAHRKERPDDTNDSSWQSYIREHANKYMHPEKKHASCASIDFSGDSIPFKNYPNIISENQKNLSQLHTDMRINPEKEDLLHEQSNTEKCMYIPSKNVGEPKGYTQTSDSRKSSFEGAKNQPEISPYYWQRVGNVSTPLDSQIDVCSPMEYGSEMKLNEPENTRKLENKKESHENRTGSNETNVTDHADQNIASHNTESATAHPEISYSEKPATWFESTENSNISKSMPNMNINVHSEDYCLPQFNENPIEKGNINSIFESKEQQTNLLCENLSTLQKEKLDLNVKAFESKPENEADNDQNNIASWFEQANMPTSENLSPTLDENFNSKFNKFPDSQLYYNTTTVKNGVPLHNPPILNTKSNIIRPLSSKVMPTIFKPLQPKQPAGLFYTGSPIKPSMKLLNDPIEVDEPSGNNLHQTSQNNYQYQNKNLSQLFGNASNDLDSLFN